MDKLQQLRNNLDELDSNLIVLIACRFDICREIAAYKSETGIPMMQENRLAEVKRRAAANGKAAGLSEEFITSLYDLVINEACRIEDEIIKRDSDTRFAS